MFANFHGVNNAIMADLIYQQFNNWLTKFMKI